MHIHLIAIGGSAMHNFALALHDKGFKVSGSDDEINEPSLSRLRAKGLLPQKIGWFPDKINTHLDAVILGMHAREDNPELIKARQLGLKIYSYPEYLFEQTKDKKRVVIGGSHGKTSITAMILHVLKYQQDTYDFMVGAQLEGFDNMVQLTKDAKVAVFEGDEYLASPIERRPKFHFYRPHIALLSGIAWDHINVFPTFEVYLEQFRLFIDTIEENGCLIFCDADEELLKLSKKARPDIRLKPYHALHHEIKEGITYVLNTDKKVPLMIFGEHNLMNLHGALLVCKELGISENDFFERISTFKGASKRLELVKRSDHFSFYKDFAHSPSKLKATIRAMKEQFPNRPLIACVELHTFSSLNETFLNEYNGCMNDCTEAIVYFNPHTIEHKKLKPITTEQIKKAFNREDIKIFTNSQELKAYLSAINWLGRNLLMMSSGNFDGIDFNVLAQELKTT